MNVKSVRIIIAVATLLAMTIVFLAWYFMGAESISPAMALKRRPWIPFFSTSNPKFNEFEEISAKIIRKFLDMETNLSPTQKRVLSTHKEDVISILTLNAICSMNYFEKEITRELAIAKIKEMYSESVNISTITFYGIDFNEIPYEGLSFFKNTDRLTMRDCKITEGIEKLICMKKLFFLNLRDNDIKKIPNFRGFENLKLVDFCGNKKLSMDEQEDVELEMIGALLLLDTNITISDARKIAKKYPGIVLAMDFKDIST